MPVLNPFAFSSFQLGFVSGILTYAALVRYPQRGDLWVLHEAFGFVLVTSIYLFCSGLSLFESLSTTSIGWIYHVVFLTLSAVLYRLSPFHPLAKFPGPILGRITSLYLVYIVATGKRHLKFIELHKKYGTFVRTGPNTISINLNEAVGTIYSSASAWNKSPAYSLGLLPGRGLFFIQDRETHNQRKRHYWTPALTNDSVNLHAHMVQRWTDTLVQTLTKNIRSDNCSEISTTLQRWSHDITGELTFGDAYDTSLLKDGDRAKTVDTAISETQIFEALGESPALFHLMWYLPVTRMFRSMHDIGGSYIASFPKRNSNGNALMSHWLGEKAAHVQALCEDDVKQEAVLAIQGGSNGISTAVTFALLYLALHPDIQTRLKRELQCAFPDSDGSHELNIHVLAELPYLNAVTEESMRLGAPLGSFARITPCGGAVIQGTVIPEGTIVGIPSWAQMTSEQNFYPNPCEFRPERWLPGGLGPGSRLVRSAIMTFSHGPFGCPGRQLAYLEMRVALVKILLCYNLRIPPWFDARQFFNGVRNRRATTFRYPLYLQLS